MERLKLNQKLGKGLCLVYLYQITINRKIYIIVRIIVLKYKKMGQKSEKLDKILELFYEFPSKRFTVRSISNKTKIPKSTVQDYLNKLKEQELVTKENTASNSGLFKMVKRQYWIRQLFKAGIIDYLKKELVPSCIILFGSFAKSESVKESDIDIFIETPKKAKLDLSRFEKKLNHKIQIFAEKDINNLPDRLFNNVINGIKLAGFFKIK